MQSLPSINDLRATVAARLGEQRRRHTLGVEEEMVRLGAIYLPGRENALRTAALLHDLTKEWSGEEQLAFCEENGIEITKAERAAPRILHAKTGAFLAGREFSLYADREVMDAIARHTVGAPQMTMLDCLLYLADYIEPTREYPDCVRLRQEFYQGLLHTNDPTAHLYTILLAAFKASIAEVRERGGVVAEETEGAIAFLNERIKKRPQNRN